MFVKNVLLIVSLVLVSLTAHAGLNIQHWQTASGTRVYFVENHDLPIIDVSINFPAGSARDTQASSGVAGITRYMMTLGAAGMDEETLTNEFADIGAVFGGEFDLDRAGFKLRTLTSEQSKALETFNKVLHKPDFPEAVFAREKVRIVSGLQESATKPESISNKLFMRALYGTHPYSLSEDGEEQTISALQVSDLRKFYQAHYTAKSAVIAMIGDMTQAQARAIADNMSAGLPQGPAIAKLPPVAPLTAPNVQSEKHPASQAHIMVGQPGIKRGDPDYFPLYVGNYILGGGGFVSRLTEEVREKRGLVYSVYSYFMPMAEAGPFQIGLQTKKEQANDALKLVNSTVQQFVEKGVTEKELKAAKSNLIGGFPMRIDSNSKILDYISVIGFYQLPLTYLDEFNAQIAKVTTQQIKEAYQRRIKQANFATVIVGAQE
jgi:zinc protease